MEINASSGKSVKEEAAAEDHVHTPYLTKTGTFCVTCDKPMKRGKDG
jgi:hypothetical protein